MASSTPCTCGHHQAPVTEHFLLPEVFWTLIQTALPAPTEKRKPGRPRMEDRQAMTAIFYVLRTGCQWKALPRCFGAASTVHDRFQAWRAAGVFAKIWTAALQYYDDLDGIDWDWQSLDGAMTKAPLGGKRYRAQSHRSREVGHETQSADRWDGGAVGRDGRRCQCERLQIGRGDLGGVGHRAA